MIHTRSTPRPRRDSDASSVHSTTSSLRAAVASEPVRAEMISTDQLREAYEQFRKLEDDERNFTKQLREIKGAKNVLKENFVRYMEATENAKIQIRGSSDALELVEVKKNETLTKEILRQRTIDFFARIGTTPEYRRADAREQCELIIQEVFNKKEFQMVKKLKHTVDKRRQKLKQDIERSIPPTVTNPTQTVRRIVRQP
jgi:hypothetical protein